MSRGSSGEKPPSEENHPARWVLGIFFLIFVCRATETIPLIGVLPLGDITVLILIVTLFTGPKHLLVPFYDTPLTKAVTAFGLLAILSVAYSIWPVQSIRFVISSGLLIAILYVSLVKIIRAPRDVQFFFRLMIIGSALFTFTGIVLGDWDGRIRVQSAFDTNDLAMFLVVILPMTLSERALAKTRLHSMLLGILTLGMILLIILTSSRGGFLALVAVSCYLLLFPGFVAGRQQASMRTKFARLAAIVILGTSILLLAPSHTRERILGITELSEDYNVTYARGGRLGIWSRGMEYLGSHPWGGGVASYQRVDAVMGGQFKAPHNSFVQVFVETGVINGAIYLSLFFGSWLGLRRVAKSISRQSVLHESQDAQIVYAYSHALAASLIGFVVAGFFLSHGYSPMLFSLWAFVGVVIRLARRNAIGENIGESQMSSRSVQLRRTS